MDSNKDQRKKMKLKEKTRLGKVAIGNLLRPCFAADGELIGFEFRDELIPMLHMKNGKKPINLRRAIRSCMYMNRIL